jgi:thiol-disulfide isomerase/thioredoxin
MKISKILLLISVILMSFIACDKIEEPFIEEIEKPDTNKKVLLEDYTGQRCVNCPAAHEIAHQLQEAYGEENLIIVAAHTGFFADPVGEPFDYDFRTDAGNAYASYFNVQTYPTGMVDRVNSGGNYLIDKDGWGTQVAAQFEETPIVNIDIQPEVSGNQVSGKINLFFLESLSAQANIQIWITEDSIVSPQVIPGGVDDEYVHMHVLRGSLNGDWGNALPAATYNADDEISIDIPTYNFGNDWETEHLSIVAFVYDEATKKVIQVDKKKLSE